MPRRTALQGKLPRISLGKQEPNSCSRLKHILVPKSVKNICFSDKRHSYIDRLRAHLNCSTHFYLERTELLWNPSSSSTCIVIYIIEVRTSPNSFITFNIIQLFLIVITIRIYLYYFIITFFNFSLKYETISLLLKLVLHCKNSLLSTNF